MLGTSDGLAKILRDHRIDEVMISSRKIAADRLRHVEAVCGASGVPVMRASVRMESTW